MQQSHHAPDSSLPMDWYDPKWFVLYVRVNQEKRTAQRLKEQEIDHFLPCYRSVRQWKDRRTILDMPLFPGYVFVHLPLSECCRVQTLANVVCLVGARHSPATVSDDEISWIRQGLEQGNAAPHPYIDTGEHVLITSGPLRGMQGIFLRNHNKDWVVVALASIARSFVVEVSVDCIRPLRQAA